MASGIVLAGVATTIWIVKIRRTKAWITNAVQQWEYFSAVKSQLGVTTEVTVLDIHSTDPLGAWVTIHWDKFGHVQRASVEALPDEIWRDSVLLICPDLAQIQVHDPWPDIYYLLAAKYHTFVSAEGLAYFRNARYQSLARVNPARAG